MDSKKLGQLYTDRQTEEARKAQEAAERLARAGDYLRAILTAHDLASDLLEEIGFTTSEVPMLDRRGCKITARQFKTGLIPLGKLKSGRKHNGAEGYAQIWLNRGYEDILRPLSSRTAGAIIKTVLTERILVWPTQSEIGNQTLAFGVKCFTHDGNGEPPKEESHERCQNFDFVEELASKFEAGSLTQNEVYWLINEQQVDYPPEPLLGSLQTIQKAVGSR